MSSFIHNLVGFCLEFRSSFRGSWYLYKVAFPLVNRECISTYLVIFKLCYNFQNQSPTHLLLGLFPDPCKFCCVFGRHFYPVITFSNSWLLEIITVGLSNLFIFYFVWDFFSSSFFFFGKRRKTFFFIWYLLGFQYKFIRNNDDKQFLVLPLKINASNISPLK